MKLLSSSFPSTSSASFTAGSTSQNHPLFTTALEGLGFDASTTTSLLAAPSLPSSSSSSPPTFPSASSFLQTPLAIPPPPSAVFQPSPPSIRCRCCSEQFATTEEAKAHSLDKRVKSLTVPYSQRASRNGTRVYREEENGALRCFVLLCPFFTTSATQFQDHFPSHHPALRIDPSVAIGRSSRTTNPPTPTQLSAHSQPSSSSSSSSSSAITSSSSRNIVSGGSKVVTKGSLSTSLSTSTPSRTKTRKVTLRMPTPYQRTVAPDPSSSTSLDTPSSSSLHHSPSSSSSLPPAPTPSNPPPPPTLPAALATSFPSPTRPDGFSQNLSALLSPRFDHYRREGFFPSHLADLHQEFGERGWEVSEDDQGVCKGTWLGRW